jgi:hypothetical protein
MYGLPCSGLEDQVTGLVLVLPGKKPPFSNYAHPLLQLVFPHNDLKGPYLSTTAAEIF